MPQDSPAALTKALKWTYLTGGVLTLVLLIGWPLLALPAGVFTQGYFTMWVVLALVWGLLASGVCIMFPIVESYSHIKKIMINAMKCTPAEPRSQAVLDTTKGVLPPESEGFGTKDVAAH